MASIFAIDKIWVKDVNDVIARELVARLCRAELRAQGLPESSVTWGGDQRARDGGVDVRVDCRSPLRSADFVKTPCSVFQVKAEKFPRHKVAKEMVPEGVLRPVIEELQDNGGSYIIVSTKEDCSDESLRNRRDAIYRCLDNHGIGANVKYDFYDAQRIADWIEKHPAVATWFRDKIGHAIQGWQPYGAWAYDEESPDSPYLVDERVRVFGPGIDAGASVLTQN